jgi:hypothetical protein
VEERLRKLYFQQRRCRHPNIATGRTDPSPTYSICTTRLQIRGPHLLPPPEARTRDLVGRERVEREVFFSPQSGEKGGEKKSSTCCWLPPTRAVLIHASNYACVTSVVGYMSLSSCVGVPQDIYPALLRLDDYPLDLATDLGRLEPFERKRRRHLQSELGRHTHTVQKTGGELHKRTRVSTPSSKKKKLAI